MSNSKFKSPFSPDSRKSPQRTLSPDLTLAIIKEVGEVEKEAVFTELREAVNQLSSDLSKFFGHFKTSPSEKWSEVNPFLSNVPASLDLRLIIGLPNASEYERTKLAFLPLVNDVVQVRKLLDSVDSQFWYLEDPDLLFQLCIRATLLLEVQHKYARFFYQQVKDATSRLILLDELKDLEDKLFVVSFPKYLCTLALDHKLNPSLDKQQGLRDGMSEFFDHFDTMNNRYRTVQRELFQSYSSFINFGNEILPSEIEITRDEKEYFRKPFFNKVRRAVQDLMTRVTDDFDTLFTCQVPTVGEQSRAVETYNDKLEEHLQLILNQIDHLGVETLRNSSRSPVMASQDSLNVADESILSYQEIIEKQTAILESSHLRHLLCYQDKTITREELPSSELFLDTLFALEGSSRLSYDQITATENIIQRYLSSNGGSHRDFKSVSKLLDSVSGLKVLWSTTSCTCQKSRMLLENYQKRHNVHQQQRSVLARCSLPKFPSDSSKNPLSYATWRLEWQSLIESVSDKGQRIRLLRESLDGHKFAKGIVKFCKSDSEAFQKLDHEFQQKSSLGIRIAKDVYAIPLAGDSIKQESSNIRRFKDLISQLEFNDISPSQQLGTSAILHLCSSLTEPHEIEYLSRRNQMMHEDKLSDQQQFDDFLKYLDEIVRNNTTVLQARALRSCVTDDKKVDQVVPKQGFKQRDLPQRRNDKSLESQNNKFDAKKGFPKKANLQRGKENGKHCLFCGQKGHNQWGKCDQIMSLLTDQPVLLKKLEEKQLCVGCLHSVNNGGNSHICKDSFKVKEKGSGKEVTKSALCPKYCRSISGNKRLHARICGCAAKEYVDKLKTLQSKMIMIRRPTNSPSSLLSSSSHSGNDSVAEESQANELMMEHFGESALQGQDVTDGAIHPSAVNLGNGTVIMANIEAKSSTLMEDDGGPAHLINGCQIGGCIRMAEKLHLENDQRSREEGCLYDSGSTNTCNAPEIADLATDSRNLPESFNLVTQTGVQRLALIRDQFKTKNNLRFQSIRLGTAPDPIAYTLLSVPLKYQEKYGMDAQYSVMTSGHPIVAGQDMAQNFPTVCEVDQSSGFGVFQSKITGAYLPFTTGVVHNYCEQDPAAPAAQDPLSL